MIVNFFSCYPTENTWQYEAYNLQAVLTSALAPLVWPRLAES